MSILSSDTWVVVPALNERLRLGATLLDLQRLQSRVVVVDDGSTDGTATEALLYPVFVLSHPCNCGQGAALQTGIDFALSQGARFVVTFDADGQHSADDLEPLIAPLRGGEVQVTLGSRFLGAAPRMPLARRLLLRIAIIFTRLYSGIWVTDTHNGLRAFTRDAIEQVRINHHGMAHASEILDQICQLKLEYCEVPVTIRYTRETLAKGQRGWNAFLIVAELLLRRIIR